MLKKASSKAAGSALVSAMMHEPTTASEENRSFSLYVHIPYCVRKCPYCDFNSHVVRRVPEQQYTAALIEELRHHASREGWDRRTVKSIFFGGGTPSIFEAASIGAVLEAAAKLFRFEPDIEITLEANPGTVDAGNFHGYRASGVNRISLGAQSFQPHLLEFLGRVHSAEETRAALKTLHSAGFSNFNVDLIYALPGQSIAELKADLDEALCQEPSHISAYNLTIEEGTPFDTAYRQGRIQNLAEDVEIDMARLIEEILAQAGLGRYEISNYARKGFESCHNVNYWQGGDYLGIGAGAHSHKRLDRETAWAHRWHNERNPGRYLQRIKENREAIAGEEYSEQRQAMGEYLFLGLRLTRGISLHAFRSRFGATPHAHYPEIAQWLEAGLLAEEDQYLRFTPRGRFVANELFVRFV